MGRDDVARHEAGESEPRVGNSVDEEVDAREPGDLVGLVARIGLDDRITAAGAGASMIGLGGREARDPGEDQLRSAGEAGGAMGDDRADEDPQIGLHEFAIQLDRRAEARRPERDAAVPSEMIADGAAGEDLGAELLLEVGSRHGAVVRDAGEDQDASIRESGCAELVEDGRDEPVARSRTREIVDHDARAPAAARDLAQPWRSDRLLEGLRDAGLADVGTVARRAGLDLPAVRELEREIAVVGPGAEADHGARALARARRGTFVRRRTGDGGTHRPKTIRAGRHLLPAMRRGRDRVDAMALAIDPRDTTDPAEILRAILDPERRGALYPWLHRLRQVAPVWQAEGLLGPRGWVLSRYEDVRAVLRHPNAFSDERNADIFDVGESGAAFTAMMRKQILYLSPPDHDRIRALVARHFTPRSVERWRAVAEQEVLRLLDRAIDQGKLDLVRDVAYPLPIAVICEMLGIPRSDVPLFFEWAHDFARRGDVAALTPDVIRRGEAATLGFRDYFLDLARARRRQPKDDLLTLLASARDARGSLTDDELAATCVILLQAGHETTADLISLGIRGLLLEPAALERLRAHPERIPNAVLELLRWDTSVQISQRRSREVIELAGVRIPAGETFVLLNGAANRDPAVYPDPDTLDVDRRPRDHLAFGLGRHRCLGASLARLEIETAIAALLRRFPELDFEAEPVFRGSFFLRGLASLPLRFGAGARKGLPS